ncbi:MAG: hypothetical protein KDA80_01175 [Planctomycetaceae bacterium]|nr:hypothetical protein [Planctomycetaceae bacterium]
MPDVENGRARHVLDIDTPEKSAGSAFPVIVWVHGVGWQVEIQCDVGIKPKVLTFRG